jgi:ATP-dependent helicase/nuclease subunit B
LQSVDVVVLGGLNEGVWPGQTRLDPLLSRPMRAALELDPPERRIGLSAHDFAQALGQPVVWITRADRQDNEPHVASRWLQRLTAYAGEEAAKAMRNRGAEKLALARLLDAPRRFDVPARPSPVPPLERRPAKLSVTRIETLIRDPYAVYASSDPGPQPFDAVATLPGAIDRGNLIHAILEEFIGERPSGPYDKAAEGRLMEIGRAHFDRYAEFPEIETLWWPRFRRIAKWFIATEAAAEDVSERLIERTGSIFPLPGFELSARADRLDRLSDGRIRIIDYKTGNPPGAEEVLTLAPQLPLEALIVREGGFAELGRADVARLDYYHISGRGEGGLVCPRGEREAKGGRAAQSLAATIAITETRLKELIGYYQQPDAQYLSQKIPKNSRYRGDYDHLARADEWSLAEDPDEA